MNGTHMGINESFNLRSKHSNLSKTNSFNKDVDVACSRKLPHGPDDPFTLFKSFKSHKTVLLLVGQPRLYWTWVEILFAKRRPTVFFVAEENVRGACRMKA